ncbi:hypothetical protein [Sorangium sp. So ce117]|jgi:hypothetical protein|uniref:hypothetical protein n=1 Tax=Sorangium sp. So ce117 TaxID=3133277 RepID=UPI003F5F94A4
MSRHFRAQYPVLAVIAAMSAACSSAPGGEAPGDDWVEKNEDLSTVPTYEQYRDEARRTILGRDVFVVETDMLFSDEAKLLDYYNERYTDPVDKSIINVASGNRDTRSSPKNIRYCFSAGWGQNQGTYTAPDLEPVRIAIQQAMEAWEGIANVQFVYMSALDGATCSTSGANPGVDFIVQHYSDSNTAIGPFPSNSWSNQRLLVPTSGIGRLLAIHEVGHALGFRHEHTHSGASPRCSESGTYEELTAFDTDSVMKYSDCTVSQAINGTELSALDAIGARVAYGPPDWWWAVIVN